MMDKLREKAVPMPKRFFYISFRPPLFHRLSAGIALLVLLVSCGETVENDRPRLRHASTTNTSFEEKSEVKYAEGFRLSYHEGYKLLQVLNPYQDTQDTLQYLLRPRGTKWNSDIPADHQQAQIIEIPVRSLIATSTTHIALTGALNANDIITGMAGAKYVYDAGIRERLAQGEITAFSEGELNMEEAMAMGPDLVMVSAGQSSQIDDYNVLLDSGINVFVNSEWLETTPLGKAEWIKVMGALLNKEAQANEFFSRVEEEYLELQDKVSGVDDKPTVINNMPFKGAWFVSGGE